MSRTRRCWGRGWDKGRGGQGKAWRNSLGDFILLLFLAKITFVFPVLSSSVLYHFGRRVFCDVPFLASFVSIACPETSNMVSQK